MSDGKRVKNDIEDIETSCDHQVSPSAYLIVKVQIDGFAELSTEEKNSFAKKLLSAGQGDGASSSTPLPPPSVVYKNTDGDLFLLFPPTADGRSQQNIISRYASMVSLELRLECQVSLVELASQAKTLIFFQVKVHACAIDSIVSGKVRRREVESVTFSEAKDLYRSKTGKDWETLPKEARYGMFYRKLGGRYATLSEPIDLRNPEKYQQYFFV